MVVEKETKLACAFYCFSHFLFKQREGRERKRKKQVGREEIKVWNSSIC